MKKKTDYHTSLVRTFIISVPFAIAVFIISLPFVIAWHAITAPFKFGSWLFNRNKSPEPLLAKDANLTGALTIREDSVSNGLAEITKTAGQAEKEERKEKNEAAVLEQASALIWQRAKILQKASNKKGYDGEFAAEVGVLNVIGNKLSQYEIGEKHKLHYYKDIKVYLNEKAHLIKTPESREVLNRSLLLIKKDAKELINLAKELGLTRTGKQAKERDIFAAVLDRNADELKAKTSTEHKEFKLNR